MSNTISQVSMNLFIYLFIVLWRARLPNAWVGVGGGEKRSLNCKPYDTTTIVAALTDLSVGTCHNNYLVG